METVSGFESSILFHDLSDDEFKPSLGKLISSSTKIGIKLMRSLDQFFMVFGMHNIRTTCHEIFCDWNS